MKSFRKSPAKFALFSLLIVFGTGLAQAELVEIPLPELLGEYPLEGYPTIPASFDFIMDPNNINGAAIRISGTHIPGLLYCEGEPNPYIEWGMAFYFSIIDFGFNEFWIGAHEGLLESGDFSIIINLESLNGYSPTWQTLGDETGIIEVDVGPTPSWCFGGEIEFPSAIISEAVIIFDMESTVSVEPARWGSVKARYRN
jgi:hypothetical protein